MKMIHEKHEKKTKKSVLIRANLWQKIFKGFPHFGHKELQDEITG